jgi:AraC-like DNA-binding protein
VGTEARRLLCEWLPLGEPSPEAIARHLHLSVRTLQRKLANEGTSFTRLLDDTRRALALAYLADGRHAVGEIAYLLGYSHTASFTHACARWTGRAPRSIRRATGSASRAKV